MSEQLLGKLTPRLRKLDQGGYERVYRSGALLRRTALHQLVGDLLDSLNIAYKESAKVRGEGDLVADFLVNGVLVFVERELEPAQQKALAAKKLKVVLIKQDPLRSDREDHGIRVMGIGGEGRLQTIFLDDPSFNFDYAHILPKTQKCSVMHGHTSSVLVEVIGHPEEGMVVDFGDAKRIVREAVRSLDHKLFINAKYVTRVDPKRVELRFETVHGEFAISAPKDTTVMLEGEATVENLAREVLERIAPMMPKNVTAVGVYVYEGLNKGSHILARLHRDGARSGRRKP